jgi:hypothetical protein
MRLEQKFAMFLLKKAFQVIYSMRLRNSMAEGIALLREDLFSLKQKN